MNVDNLLRTIEALGVDAHVDLWMHDHAKERTKEEALDIAQQLAGALVIDGFVVEMTGIDENSVKLEVHKPWVEIYVFFGKGGE